MCALAVFISDHNDQAPDHWGNLPSDHLYSNPGSMFWWIDGPKLCFLRGIETNVCLSVHSFSKVKVSCPINVSSLQSIVKMWLSMWGCQNCHFHFRQFMCLYSSVFLIMPFQGLETREYSAKWWDAYPDYRFWIGQDFQERGSRKWHWKCVFGYSKSDL